MGGGGNGGEVGLWVRGGAGFWGGFGRGGRGWVRGGERGGEGTGGEVDSLGGFEAQVQFSPVGK